MFALSFVACDNYEEPNPQPQTNPQEPVYSATDVDLKPTAPASIDLPALNAAKVTTVEVIKVDSVGVLPEGFKPSFTYQLSDTEGFDKVATIPVTLDETGKTGSVTTDGLEEAYEELIGLSTSTRKIYARALAYGVNGTMVSRLGGENTYFAATSFELTPDAMIVLYTPGNANGWNAANSLKVYSTDNVTFSGVAYLDGEFKFADTLDWSGIDYGAGDEPGTLLQGSQTNLKVDEAGLYWVDLNVEELTYSLSYLSTLGAIGSFNNWLGDIPLTPNDNYSVWTGVVEFDEGGEWKVRANNDWAISFGGSYNDIVYNGGNLAVPGAGAYKVTLDFNSRPYIITTAKE